MAQDDDPTRDSAPDLQILGDQITLQPRSYVEPAQQEKEEALMHHMARFRSEPLQFLREVSLYVSGTGWRAYDKVIGQPIFYSGFSEQMKNAVVSAPLLQDRICQLTELRLEVEEKDGWLRKDDPDFEVKKAHRRTAIHEGLQEVADKLTSDMICKSHVDYVSMQLICYRLGLALPVVVAGDNLNFPVVGAFLQHAGAMWIRRSFGNDSLYTTLVQTYIDTLLQNGYNFECFIEGGRSRTGKLLSPKFGILSFILDSLLSGRVEDAIICPVSTQYDKVIETEGYVTELLGVPKKKENLADFLSGGTSVLSLKLGRVDVRFHEPWSLRGYIDDQLKKFAAGSVPRDLSIKTPETVRIKQKLLRTMGYKVLSEINDVSVVMPTALIGTVLLTLRGRGVGKTELMRRVEWLSNRVRAKGGRVAHFGTAPLSDVVERGLEVLGKDLVGVVSGLAEPTYYAVDRFQLSFYRNMTIHLFISEALVSAAMYTRVKRGGGPAVQDIGYDDLRSQVLFLSSLFRGEFIFPADGLAANLEKTLVGLEHDRIIHLARDQGATSSPWASWLAATSLIGLTPPLNQKEDIWIELAKAQNSAQLFGKTLYHQGDLSYFEAVNKETLKNAYSRFEEEGILYVVKSKDAKTNPARLRISHDWMPSRDPGTGDLVPTGRLWEFTEKIASSRREGKNRRDGATVSTRVLHLSDLLGKRLFEEATTGPDVAKREAARLSDEEAARVKKAVGEERRRRRLEGRAQL
ncbi:acyltransferase [Apiospora rasikravindrae]|uniref:Acyltransferase n=1 Tax=Apiospora rasikravindrae TaxID=990691 RepID=A0ABR1U373_9PEZI